VEPPREASASEDLEAADTVERGASMEIAL
jgi:hypothetical protein